MHEHIMILMRKILIFFLMVPAIGFTQPTYKVHKVQPKETLYSLARQYNMPPKELAAFNNLDINTGLQIGQELRIPDNSRPAETAAPVASTAAAPASAIKTTGTPVYHTVESKETLYSISIKYGKVPVDMLKSWNGLTDGGIKVGQKLVVGYSDEAKDKNTATAVVNQPVAQAPVNEDLAQQKAELEKQRRLLEEKERELNAQTAIKAAQTNDDAAALRAKADAEKLEAEKRAEAARKAEEAAKRSEENARKAEEANKARQDEQDRRAADRTVIENMAEQNKTVASTPVSSNGKFAGGIFKSSYSPSKNVEQKGNAGVFKSTSGWEDGKYYCLHNSAPIGSVIRITNPENNSAVYAKVLDVIPDLKQNQDVIVRLSNAAAAELGKGEANFSCVINF